MKVITLHHVLSDTGSNAQGNVLFNLMKQYHEDTLVLEVSGDLSLSSSFLNSSFGQFIDCFGLQTLKSNVKIRTNKNQFARISKYINDYAALEPA
jgi:hypothetical protein